MKIVQINATCGVGSTGKICVDISKMLTAQNIENYILYSGKSNGYELGIACANRKYIKWQALKSRIFGNYGFNSRLATKRIIKELDRIQPDIVHLHNIHGHDCNLEILFDYFKMNKTKLVWTFHDCWALTGYCTHFDGIKCMKWRTECKHCEQFRAYSIFFDMSEKIHQRKKKVLSDLDLIMVTPSRWLSNIVGESFLREYDVRIINNGIDLNIFKPVVTPSYNEKYNIDKSKKIILGVAFSWGYKKGLDIFVDLANRLDRDKYQIILVGTNAQIDKKLPSNIISIHRTQNQKELAEIYSMADIFVNPTREENYPTVNMEAIACGTPVITFNTGGSPEILTQETGIVVSENTSDAIITAIETMICSNRYDEKKCTISAKEFDKNLKYQEYMNLYRECLMGNYSE